MNNIIKTDFDQFASILDLSIEKIDYYYPRITETLIPLSSTGITAYNYFHWKKEGLVDSPENIENENRTWVRLNIFQFVWLKIIETMRSFGLPLSAIKKAKEFLFLEYFEQLKKEKDEIEDFLKTYSNYSPEKIETLKRIIEEIDKIETIPDEDKILFSSIGLMIASILLRDDQGSLFVFIKDENFIVTSLPYKTINDFQILANELFRYPHIQIPIRPLIESFFDEPRNENVVISYGFINPKEMKVLNAIRKNDFKEIIIRFENSDREQMILEEIIDGDLRDQKAKEIKRILGMNQYSEVTLKLRNDKHIYFKNKIRL